MIIYVVLLYLLIPSKETVIKNFNAKNSIYDNISIPISSLDAVQKFLKRSEQKFKIDADNLKLLKKEKVGKEKFIYTYKQFYKNIPVYNGVLKVFLEKKGNHAEVKTVIVNCYRGKFEIPKKTVSLDLIQKKLKKQLNLRGVPFTKMVFYNGKLSYLLSYPVIFIKNQVFKFDVIVNAKNGKILYLKNRIKY